MWISKVFYLQSAWKKAKKHREIIILICLINFINISFPIPSPVEIAKNENIFAINLRQLKNEFLKPSFSKI